MERVCFKVLSQDRMGNMHFGHSSWSGLSNDVEGVGAGHEAKGGSEGRTTGASG